MTAPATTPFRNASNRGTGANAAGARRCLADLPGPAGLPLIGNMLQIDLKKLHLILERWAARFGPVFLFRLGPVPVVAITDPAWSDQVLRSRPDGFTRGMKTAPVFAELGLDGVFSAEGDAWRRQRRLAVFALAQRNLRSQYAHLLTVADRLKRRWDRLADEGATIDMVEELKRFTVDATTLIAFGYDINTIEQNGDVIQRKLELVFPTFTRRLFAMVPFWRMLRLPRDRRVDRAVADLRIWLAGLVAAERERLARDPARAEKPSNFLEAMVAARDGDGRPYPDDVIFANLMTMLLAGEDTTAYTLAWAVHHLCDSLDASARIRSEADDVLGTATVPSDGAIANQLVWAGAIADETMRLRPVAPIMVFNAIGEAVIGDVLVPAGTQVLVLSRPGAVDLTNFPDPRAFRPQRWLDRDLHDATAYIPFGSGPRICPGRALALLEMKLILAMLCKNFDLERVGRSEDVTEEFSFTMVPVGLEVRLHRRHTRA